MNWDKIIFWFDAEEDKIYWSRFEFIKVNKKLKSLTKSVHHVGAVDFSPWHWYIYYRDRIYEYELADQNCAIKREMKGIVMMQL